MPCGAGSCRATHSATIAVVNPFLGTTGFAGPFATMASWAMIMSITKMLATSRHRPVRWLVR